MNATERLAREVLAALDDGPAPSQKALATRLDVKEGDLGRALTLLEKRGVIVRESVQGSVAKSIRLVTARNNIARELLDERHYTPSEVAALVDRGELVVTASWVLYRRGGR
jgi:DNA-binding GntR family transcriptional regulator